MFASRVSLRSCQPLLQNGYLPRTMMIKTSTSRRNAAVEQCLRSLSTSSYRHRSNWSRKTAINRDETSRPRFREHRRSSEDPVLSPEEAVGIVLRSSTIDDCHAIYKMLLAHAEWEGCLDLVKITEEDIRRDFFGERPISYCDLAEVHGDSGQTSLIGYGLYSFHFCAWEGKTGAGENIFIHHQYRDLGIGSILLHEISKKMYALGCRSISGYFDENEIGLKRWYIAEGYENLTEKHNFHLYSQSGEKLERYIHQHDKQDEYLAKAKSRGIHIESRIPNKDGKMIL
ncbi:thialysine N-epsilon-acetyltransferase-like [Lytechinus variegatus]|uniref:thialysine N-epsilon-acetyltransferase-like n=1 Tax=Lytechinus variegatus TaxID=7654 RepID=UPI001BB1D6EA|nr:thialysine N-epsilon-acetyltransferase-like [Lytechinus variegatus]